MTITANDINSIIVKQIRCKIEDLRNDVLMHDDLGIDSLDTVEILLTIEEEFGVVVEEDQLHKGMTVKEFTEVILRIAQQ